MLKRLLVSLQIVTLAVVGVQLIPSAAQAVNGSVTCGTNGHAAYTIAYARQYGLLTTSKGPGPTSPYDIAAKIKTLPGAGDPYSGNDYGLWEVGIWTFVGNLANVNFGASQAISGGSYPVQFVTGQCTGQAGPTGTVAESHTDSYVGCPAGSRAVVWSDGWGNHWVRYRSSASGAYKYVKTMWSNYGTLKMGSAFIDEQEIFDVTLMATTSKPRSAWPDDFIPGWRISCNTDGLDPKLN